MRPRLVTVLVFALAGLMGCEETKPDLPAPAVDEVVQRVPDALDLVSVDELPSSSERVPGVASNLPQSFPQRDAELPSLLEDPPGRVLMVYRPYEGSTESSRMAVGELPGWAGETVFFRGVDGRWRRLDLGSLGLSAAEHAGDDSYGVGRLSPDGWHWAAPTWHGVLRVDLATGESRWTALAGARVSYVRWRVDGRLQVVGTVGTRGRQTVWQVGPAGELTAIAWPREWSTWVDPSGDAVLFDGRRSLPVRRLTWSGDNPSPRSERLPFKLGTVTSWASYGNSVYSLQWFNRGPTGGSAYMVVDAATDMPLRGLTGRRDDAPMGYSWWVGDQLMVTRGRDLLVWDPRTGRVRIAARTPPASPRIPARDMNRSIYWHADLATNLVRLER